MLELKLIELYCLICHFYDNQIVLKHQRLSNNSKPEFTDCELVTCYFFGMLENHRQQKAIYNYIAKHWRAWFPALPTYQAFNNRLNNLQLDFQIIIELLLTAKFKNRDAGFSADSLVDSFPVMLSTGEKAKRCRTASELADFGYCSSKDIYYHGVKLHTLAVRRTGKLPLPSNVFLSQASKHDLTAFKETNPPIPTNTLFADKAYADEQTKLLLQERGVTIITPRKRKRGEQKTGETLWSRFVSSFKQPIESFFNWLILKTDYQNASRVRSTKGLLIHCYGKLAFACLLLCFYS
jgi:hypothetical protein